MFRKNFLACCYSVKNAQLSILNFSFRRKSHRNTQVVLASSNPSNALKLCWQKDTNLSFYSFLIQTCWILVIPSLDYFVLKRQHSFQVLIGLLNVPELLESLGDVEVGREVLRESADTRVNLKKFNGNNLTKTN